MIPERPSQIEPPAEGPREQTIDEVIALHHGEWVLLKVTVLNEHQEPAKGLVLAHSSRRSAITEALRKEPPRSAQPPDVPPPSYYTFNAFPRVRPGETFEQASARFTHQLAAAREARGSSGPQ